jgi:hypothetical protein
MKNYNILIKETKTFLLYIEEKYILSFLKEKNALVLKYFMSNFHP